MSKNSETYHTDGSYNQKTGAASFGVHSGSRDFSGSAQGAKSSNQAELRGAQAALNHASSKGTANVNVHTDSAYVMRAARGQGTGSKGEQQLNNQQASMKSLGQNVAFQQVKSGSGGNKVAHNLAKKH